MNATVASAYMIGAITFVVSIILAIAIANGIRYEGGINPQDKRKRRIWFWILAILCPIAFMTLCYFGAYADIRIPSRRDAYLAAMAISSGLFCIAYIVCGFILSKSFPHGKLSSWF